MLKKITILYRNISVIWAEIDTYLRYSDRSFESRLDISTESEWKWYIYMAKSKFGCWQPERNQISKIEDMTVKEFFETHF